MTSPRFRYRVAQPDGRIRKGVLTAPSEAEASRRLRDEGLDVIRVRRLRRLLLPQPVKRQDVAVAFRNVATLVAAGVPIERAIGASESLVSPRLGTLLAEVRRLVREGRSVSQALAATPSLLPRSAVGMIRAGERGSALAEACDSVADQLEESAGLQSRVRSALAYPVLILVMGVATIGVMGTVVVPRFADVLSDLGGQLPPATRALLATASLLRRFGVPATLATVVSVPIAVQWVRIPKVRARLDRVLLRLPIVGSIRLGFASARACRALGGMLENGMPLLAALSAAEDAPGDAEVSRRLGLARDMVARGIPLTEALRTHVVLSSSALQLAGVGESSGQLGAMLSRAARVVGDQTERSLRTAVGLLEPLLVVVLGGLVAIVAAALLQAVYSIRPT